MSRSTAADRLPLGDRPWICDPQAILCVNDHLLALYKTGYRGDLSRLSGHSFLECRECQPATYFLAVHSPLPSPMVTCYAISREAFLEWDSTNEPTPPTPELLHRLRDPQGRSHNPYYRPPTPRKRS